MCMSGSSGEELAAVHDILEINAQKWQCGCILMSLRTLLSQIHVAVIWEMVTGRRGTLLGG